MGSKLVGEYRKQQMVIEKEAIDNIEFFFENAENPHIDLVAYNGFFTRIVIVLRLYDDSKGLEHYVEQRFLENKKVLDIICRCSETNPVIFGLFTGVVNIMNDRHIGIGEYLMEHFYPSIWTKGVTFGFNFTNLDKMKSMFAIIQKLRCHETRCIVIDSDTEPLGNKGELVTAMKEYILRTKVKEVRCEGEAPSAWIEELQVIANTPLYDRDLPLEYTTKSAAKSTYTPPPPPPPVPSSSSSSSS